MGDLIISLIYSIIYSFRSSSQSIQQHISVQAWPFCMQTQCWLLQVDFWHLHNDKSAVASSAGNWLVIMWWYLARSLVVSDLRSENKGSRFEIFSFFLFSYFI